MKAWSKYHSYGRVACCMTVRNCAPYLPKVFENIDRLSRLFPQFVVIVAYDHCSDMSEYLLKWYRLTKGYPIYLLPGSFTSPHRTVRIAAARNRCIELLEKLDIDTHFMVDADDVNQNPWNLTLIKYYLSRKDWDCLSFNREPYYDIWALMYPPFHHHCWGFRERSRDVVKYIQADIQKKLQKVELFECDSAFNGFAIYRSNVFQGVRYSGWAKDLPFIKESRQNPFPFHVEFDDNFPESCEHLYYHLTSKARIRISGYSI